MVWILSPDVLNFSWTRGGSGSIKASGRSRLYSSSIPGPSGSNVGCSKSKSAIRSNCWRQNSLKGCRTTSIHNGSSRFGRKLNPYCSLWVSKECDNLWSSPTILAASTRTSSSACQVPQPWQRRCDCPRDREAALHDHAGQRRCQQDCGSESGPRHREELTIKISGNGK